MTPKFKHDCDGCVFLEHWENMDWYYCHGVSRLGCSIIGRCGDEGSDYVSSALGVLLSNSSLDFHEQSGGPRENCRSSFMIPAYYRNEKKIQEIAALAKSAAK